MWEGAKRSFLRKCEQRKLFVWRTKIYLQDGASKHYTSSMNVYRWTQRNVLVTVGASRSWGSTLGSKDLTGRLCSPAKWNHPSSQIRLLKSKWITRNILGDCKVIRTKWKSINVNSKSMGISRHTKHSRTTTTILRMNDHCSGKKIWNLN